MSQYPSFIHVALEAVEKLKSNGLSAAREYLASLPDQEYRDYALGKMAVALAADNQPDVLDLVDEIVRPLERADAFIEVGHEYERRQHSEEAKEAFLRAVVTVQSMEPDL